jgi:hypothetical protein
METMMDDPKDLEDQVKQAAILAFTLHKMWLWNERPVILRFVRLSPTSWQVYFDLLSNKDYVFVKVNRLGETLYASCIGQWPPVDWKILRKRLFEM